MRGGRYYCCMKPATRLNRPALYDIETSRRIELELARLSAPHNGPHHLMACAGAAIAKLALAIAPHARTIGIACGPGNNGGDGLIAAMALLQAGKAIRISRVGGMVVSAHTPPDAAWALEKALQAGLTVQAQLDDADLAECDLVIDALLGIGAKQALGGLLLSQVQKINAQQAQRGISVLAVDLPTGLHADTGDVMTISDPLANDGLSGAIQASHTLSLVCLRPGLFTGQGKQLCGQVWLEDLGASRLPDTSSFTPVAYWNNPAENTSILTPSRRSHTSHKGSFGDVLVIGGAAGMQGAALLAAQAAHQTGAGRVMVSFLSEPTSTELASLPVQCPHPIAPDLMLRRWQDLDLAHYTVVCGCGGAEGVSTVLPPLLAQCPRLVLDADALNALARDPGLIPLLKARQVKGWETVLTPHPKEGARLLQTQVNIIQSARLKAAYALADQTHCTVVLKGSGTIVIWPGATPIINSSGNGKLAIAGTGDVLAGMVGSYLAQDHSGYDAAQKACYWHGWVADQWPAGETLTASAMVSQLPQA